MVRSLLLAGSLGVWGPASGVWGPASAAAAQPEAAAEDVAVESQPPTATPAQTAPSPEAKEQPARKAKGKRRAAKQAADAQPTSEANAEQDATKDEIPLPNTGDRMRDLQTHAFQTQKSSWGYWGDAPLRYSTWVNHSNRLIPIYTFGITLDRLREAGSIYTDAERLRALYGDLPTQTLNAEATYFDQTDVYRLQQQAIAAGKTQVILVVFDGMDWESTYNAALYRNGRIAYTSGRGTGLVFQDYRGVATDYGCFVTAPRQGSCDVDVNRQTVSADNQKVTGGYNAERGGKAAGEPAPQRSYPISLDRSCPHVFTDSAASATSMTTGYKTYNDSINVGINSEQLRTIAHQLQTEKQFAIGVVTSVPISHATPACAYSHNVSRDDYQDITRDLIGLPSVAHRQSPLPGVDVLIGCGWGVEAKADKAQGDNFVPGRKYIDPEDLARVSVDQGGKYVVAQRTPGRPGTDVLREAFHAARDGKHRLLAVFGASKGHLPFATANGDYQPTLDASGETKYTAGDVEENPKLAEMAVTALDLLERNPNGFWMMLEAGDVDWANHANNIDNSIGAVFSGDAAVQAVFDWVESRKAWDKTVVIVTADHGHYFNLKEPEAIASAANWTK